jgi:flagellar M-ring protein FliF
MAPIDNAIANISSWPARKKTALLAVTVASIAGMLLFFSWMQKADYQVLFSNLSEDDAGQIVQELNKQNTPYELGPGGTVMVSADKVYDLRLQLAAQGLPKGGGIGFEIFDNTSFTTSEFVQKLNYKRALEGELSRTIRSLSGVDQTRVHLVIPDKTMFAFQQDKPKTSAAVFVSLKTGRKLNSAEVEGIVHLVSGSVEDLSPEEITVIDSKGALLTRPSDDDVMSISGSQIEYQQGFEKNIVSKIVSILESVAGRDKVKAKVSSSFDFTRSERTEEIFDPERVVVRSEQKSTEKTRSGLVGGGIPGASSNLPGGSPGQISSSGGQSEKEDEMINYETSKTITRIVESPVSLERLTVAILVDGILSSQAGSVENADQYIQRSEEDIKYYEDIVKKTIGFSEDRGDEISVTVMPFREMAMEELPEPETNYMPMVMTVLKYLIPLLVSVLFFLIVLKPLIKAITAPVTHATPSHAVRQQGGEITGELEDVLRPSEIPLEKQVVEWANTNPQQATGLVKGWLEDV